MKNLKKFSIAGILAAGLALTACLGEDTAAPVAAPDVVLNISTDVDAVNKSGLSKSNLISLRKLIIVLTSNATPVPDTVRDTILNGTQGFSSTSTAQQVVTKKYTVKGLRTWTVTASVRDSQDTLTHSAVTVVPASFVKVADTTTVNLSLVSRFSMYEVNFASLPDSITTTSGTNHKQAITIKRLIVQIGSYSKDTSAAAFTGARQFTWDYVPTGAQTVRLVAMGTTGNMVTNDTLFSGTTSINSVVGGDSTVALNLTWKGPNTGAEKVNVTIGKVGKTIVNGGGYCSLGCVPKASK